MKQHELEAMFKSLIEELTRNERQHSGLDVIDRSRGTFFWPAPWIEVMKQRQWQALMNIDSASLEFLTMCTPLEEEQLSPMSSELRRLARKCGLPEYKGKAQPAPRPRAVGKRHKRTGERCYRCGDWMETVEAAKYRSEGPMSIFHMPPHEKSGILVCRGCGHVKHPVN